MTRSSVANPLTGSAACPVCEHINPPDSKFCNVCGTPIHLVDADEFDRDAMVARLEHLRGLLDHTDSGATGIAGGLTGGMASPAAASTASRGKGSASPPSRGRLSAERRAIRIGRRGVAAIVGTVVLAVLAAGYYGYRERPVQGPAARGTVKDSNSPAATGAIVNPPASPGGAIPRTSTPPPAVLPPVATDPQPIAPARESMVTTTRSETAVPGAARAPATTPVTGSPDGATTGARRPGVQTRDPSEAAAAPRAEGARPRSADAGPGILDRQRPYGGPCTDGVAALGLCTPQPSQSRE